MENQEKTNTCANKHTTDRILTMIAIILSIISITLSAFTLGANVKLQNKCFSNNECQNMRKRINNDKPFMPNMNFDKYSPNYYNNNGFKNFESNINNKMENQYQHRYKFNKNKDSKTSAQTYEHSPISQNDNQGPK